MQYEGLPPPSPGWLGCFIRVEKQFYKNMRKVFCKTLFVHYLSVVILEQFVQCASKRVCFISSKTLPRRVGTNRIAAKDLIICIGFLWLPNTQEELFVPHSLTGSMIHCLRLFGWTVFFWFWDPIQNLILSQNWSESIVELISPISELVSTNSEVGSPI